MSAPHGEEINQVIYWVVVGIEATQAAPSCDGCGPDSNQSPPFLTSAALAKPPLIPKDAQDADAFVLQGDWNKGHNNAIIGAKPFKRLGDANAWIAQIYNDKSASFFAKYQYVIAVPVKISTAFLSE